MTFNGEGRVSDASPLFLALTGAEAGELTGLTAAEFSAWLVQRSQSAPPFSGIALLRLRALTRENRHREVIQISAGRATGTWLEVAWFNAPADEVAGVLFVSECRAETGVHPASPQFIATAAHDLRTPLASIAGFADVLQTQGLDEQTQQEFLKIIADQAERLAQMMGALFDVLRMDSQPSHSGQFTHCTLQSIITNVVAKLVYPTGRPPPIVRMPAQPLWIMADVSQLTQALHHVLNNAYQYSPAGGDVWLDIFVLETAGQADRAGLQVRDHGIGMTPAQTLHIFDRFSRFSTPAAPAGQGLGMAVAKQAIERHHGDIRVASTPHEGTQVEVTLPLAQPGPAVA